MIEIQGKIVHIDLVEERFVCDLNACKGACCVEGDLGAPLEPHELNILEQEYEYIAPFITEAGRAVIAAEGKHINNGRDGDMTPLINGADCAYLTKDALGISKCGIEQAWQAGVTSFRKPISCHLYPIRVSRVDTIDYEVLNYDRWDICSAACTLGNKLKVPVYRFLQEAIERKYGAAFFQELDEVATAWQKERNNTV